MAAEVARVTLKNFGKEFQRREPRCENSEPPRPRRAFAELNKSEPLNPAIQHGVHRASR